MKNFILILTACLMFLNSLGLKTELDKNLFSTISQPTTESLIKISLAKSKSKQVTEWYTQKFISNIITFDSNMNKNLQNCFLKNFKKIASNPVGRALLFRILIEVQKDNNDKKLKKISVIQYAKIGFNEEKSLLYFDEINTKPCVIQKKKSFFKTTYTLAEETTDNIDINIFHEMCHWFHALQDNQRKKDESDVTNLFSNPLGRHYWGNIENFKASCDNIPLPLEQEGFFWTNGEKTSFEEIRTILGSNSGIERYQNGDDLCENLYRISINKKARWSHKNSDFINPHKYTPDLTTLQRAVSSAFKNYNLYQ